MSNKLVNKIAVISILVLAGVYPGVAQRVIVNGNGERLIMYPDGSWRLAEAGDSMLLRQNLQKSEAMNVPSDKIDAIDKRNPAEEEEYTLRQWNELYFRIKEYEKKAQTQFRNATNAQFKASELLQNAEANKSMIESDRLATLQENYELAVQKLKIAKLQQTEILKILDQSKKLSGKTAPVIRKKMQQLSSQFDNYLNAYDPQHNIQDLSKPDISNRAKENTVVSSTSVKDAHRTSKSKERLGKSSNKDHTVNAKESKSTSSNSASISLARTVSLRIPPDRLPKPYKSAPYPCEVIADTIDAVTKTRRILLGPGLIFTNTDPDLRPYFKSKELITCSGKLTKIGAYLYFNIDFQIASSHSQGNFGSLDAGSLLRLRLLNGKYVSLYNLKTDRGRIDPYSGNTIFSGQYALGKDETDLLSTSPLDKIRILWSTGYEDYDVYKIDFFIDQLNCLFTR